MDEEDLVENARCKDDVVTSILEEPPKSFWRHIWEVIDFGTSISSLYLFKALFVPVYQPDYIKTFAAIFGVSMLVCIICKLLTKACKEALIFLDQLLNSR